MVYKNLLSELCGKLGITESFYDFDTQREYCADDESKRAICRALGYPADDEGQAQESLYFFRRRQFDRFVPMTHVAQDWEFNPFYLYFVVSNKQADSHISWHLLREDATSEYGEFNVADTQIIEEFYDKDIIWQKRLIKFPLHVGWGYHTLSFLCDGESLSPPAYMNLIVTPASCYEPDDMRGGRRVWGYPLQLFATTSDRGWGMGDLTDLKNFAQMASDNGASLIGVNPLNALYPDNPQDASPYSASSRLFFNPLYIDTDVAPESDDVLYQKFRSSPEFKKALRVAKNSNMVEYPIVSKIKLDALGVLWDVFKKRHLNLSYRPISVRGQAFIDFCDAQNPYLMRFATFQTLRYHFLKMNKSPLWTDWPSAYQNPSSPEIDAFQTTHKDDILLIKYQQFLWFEQSRAAYAACRHIGLYVDMPVGVGRHSADVWGDQSLYMTGLTIGAPIDMYNPTRQDWNLAPLNPFVLHETGYVDYRQILSRLMNGAGAVRIDHAFGLMRLYLNVPNASGAYLSYPFKALMGLVALESHRNKCLVIVEDLGTSPPHFGEAIGGFRTFPFRLFRYQKEGDNFAPPQNYPTHCVITTGSHDFPTFAAFWMGTDLDMARKRGSSNKAYKIHKQHRYSERRAFIRAFIAQGLLRPMSESKQHKIASDDRLPDWFIPCVYAFLGRANTQILLVRPEDVLEQVEQMNLPGTYLEYPNWRYKLPVLLEDLKFDKKWDKIVKILKKERP